MEGLGEGRESNGNGKRSARQGWKGKQREGERKCLAGVVDKAGGRGRAEVEEETRERAGPDISLNSDGSENINKTKEKAKHEVRI